MTREHTVNQFDTTFIASTKKMTAGQAKWHSLKLEFYQNTDTSMVNSVTFNVIQKEDLLAMSRIFAELAEKFN